MKKTEEANQYTVRFIGRIRSDFSEKFGIPRQSGLVDELRAAVILEPEYRDPAAFRGIGGFSHLWLVWQFSQAVRQDWSPTVRPPRLGGNTRMGVFATRSPFRPNAIGLSCVRFVELRQDPEYGPVLIVAGADLLDGTPILDIKPYLPHADCHPDATGGFSAPLVEKELAVVCEEALLARLPAEKRTALLGVLAQDPRPAYQEDPERIYGFGFAGYEIRFSVAGDTLTVRDIVKKG